MQTRPLRGKPSASAGPGMTAAEPSDHSLIFFLECFFSSNVPLTKNIMNTVYYFDLICNLLYCVYCCVNLRLFGACTVILRSWGCSFRRGTFGHSNKVSISRQTFHRICTDRNLKHLKILNRKLHK